MSFVARRMSRRDTFHCQSLRHFSLPIPSHCHKQFCGLRVLIYGRNVSQSFLRLRGCVVGDVVDQGTVR